MVKWVYEGPFGYSAAVEKYYKQIVGINYCKTILSVEEIKSTLKFSAAPAHLYTTFTLGTVTIEGPEDVVAGIVESIGSPVTNPDFVLIRDWLNKYHKGAAHKRFIDLMADRFASTGVLEITEIERRLQQKVKYLFAHAKLAEDFLIAEGPEGVYRFRG